MTLKKLATTDGGTINPNNMVRKAMQQDGATIESVLTTAAAGMDRQVSTYAGAARYLNKVAKGALRPYAPNGRHFTSRDVDSNPALHAVKDRVDSRKAFWSKDEHRESASKANPARPATVKARK